MFVENVKKYLCIWLIESNRKLFEALLEMEIDYPLLNIHGLKIALFTTVHETLAFGLAENRGEWEYTLQYWLSGSLLKNW